MRAPIRSLRGQLPAALLLAVCLAAHGAWADEPRAAPDFVIGEFPIDGANGVVDGDTIRVAGLRKGVRLLALDAEETAHQNGRGVYAKRPTGLGADAKEWARRYFHGASRVRLERDHPEELEDRFGRTLAYALAFKDGAWRNFNVEAVRAGMSAYFTKYGRSRRFHAEFEEAQREARSARRGIWAPDADSYGDYPARLAAWRPRAELIAAFDAEAERDPRHVPLTRDRARRLLEAFAGTKVAVLGSAVEVERAPDGGVVVTLMGSRGNLVDLVIRDEAVLRATHLSSARGELVRAEGVIREGRAKGKPRLRIEILSASQIRIARGDANR